MNDDIGEFKLDEMRAIDAMLLGRATYEGFAGEVSKLKTRSVKGILVAERSFGTGVVLLTYAGIAGRAGAA